MTRMFVVLALAAIFSQSAQARVDLSDIQDPAMRERMREAIDAGYSVAHCAAGKCEDIESGDPVLIDNYDRDGFYLFWDEYKPRTVSSK